MPVYAIRFARDVEADLRSIPVFHRRRVVDAIAAQLSDQPTARTRNRKFLVDLVPPWTAKGTVWELRVGEYRVFYDVSEADQTVYVRAVRKKPRGRTTEQIL